MSSLSQDDIVMFQSVSSINFSIQKSKNTVNMNFNKNKENIIIIEIRRDEHFGEIFMFSNKKSPFNIRVKSQKAEIIFLRKLDVIEISSNYSHIWKRVSKISLANFVNLKKLVSKRIKTYCIKNRIRYFSKKKLQVYKNLSKENNKAILPNNKIKKNLSKINDNDKIQNKINNTDVIKNKNNNSDKNQNKIRNNIKYQKKINNNDKIYNK